MQAKTMLASLAMAGVLTLGLSGLGSTPAAAGGSGYSLFGDAQIVSPGNGSANAAQATTTGSNGYGGVDFAVPAGTTVNNVNHLSTDLRAVTGTCSTGTPRFGVGVNDGTATTKYLFFYPTCSTAWTNSGNLASPTSLVDATQLGGLFYMPYAAVQAAYGALPVVAIFLVVDTSNGTQTIQFDNSQVNNTIYTYEPSPKEACKDGGFANFDGTRGTPGPFKNQGDCVSFFANN